MSLIEPLAIVLTLAGAAYLILKLTPTPSCRPTRKSLGPSAWRNQR